MKIIGFSESNLNVSVTVEGPGHVELGNFIEQVTRKGYTTDPGPTNLSVAMSNGYRVSRSTFRFRWDGSL